MERPKNTVRLSLLAALAVLLGQPAQAAPVPGDPPPELRLVLPDTFAVLHVHVSDLLSRELPRESERFLSHFSRPPGMNLRRPSWPHIPEDSHD